MGRRVNNVLTIREIQEADLELIRKWRNNDREWFHNKDIITPEMQAGWYKRYLADDSDMLFMAEMDGVPIGIYGLINIRTKTAEAGRLIIGDKRYTGKKLGVDIIRLIWKYAFEELGVDEIYTDILANNKAIVISTARAGYTIVGFKKPDIIYLNITREDFYSD